MWALYGKSRLWYCRGVKPSKERTGVAGMNVCFKLYNYSTILNREGHLDQNEQTFCGQVQLVA